MAFSKVQSYGFVDKTAYINFDSNEVHVIVPETGSVKLTQESFVSLLDYFDSLEYMIAKHFYRSRYYRPGDHNLRFPLTTPDGNLVIANSLIQPNNDYPDIIFFTVKDDTGDMQEILHLHYSQVLAIVEAAEEEGLTATGKKYKDVRYVTKFPSETYANRNVVYHLLTDDTLYIINEVPHPQVFDSIDLMENITVLDRHYETSIDVDSGYYIYDGKLWNRTDTVAELLGTIVDVEELPDISDGSIVEDEYIYILTETTNDGQKGTAYVFEDNTFIPYGSNAPMPDDYPDIVWYIDFVLGYGENSKRLENIIPARYMKDIDDEFVMGDDYDGVNRYISLAYRGDANISINPPLPIPFTDTPSNRDQTLIDAQIALGFDPNVCGVRGGYYMESEYLFINKGIEAGKFRLYCHENPFND